MDGDKLPQVTTLDFSFIQHVCPLGVWLRWPIGFVIPESSDVARAARGAATIQPAPDGGVMAHAKNLLINATRSLSLIARKNKGLR
jgi:hypothetical protein